MTTLDDIDTPYPLKDILPLAYPNGGMTLSGLRKEIARGNLVVECSRKGNYILDSR